MPVGPVHHRRHAEAVRKWNHSANTIHARPLANCAIAILALYVVQVYGGPVPAYFVEVLLNCRWLIASEQSAQRRRESIDMMGEQGDNQVRLFCSFNLEDHVPADHLLREWTTFLI
jgi:hypothetical protein